MQRQYDPEKGKQDWIRRQINERRTRKHALQVKEDEKRLSSSTAKQILVKKCE